MYYEIKRKSVQIRLLKPVLNAKINDIMTVVFSYL